MHLCIQIFPLYKNRNYAGWGATPSDLILTWLPLWRLCLHRSLSEALGDRTLTSEFWRNNSTHKTNKCTRPHWVGNSRAVRRGMQKDICNTDLGEELPVARLWDGDSVRTQLHMGASAWFIASQPEMHFSSPILWKQNWALNNFTFATWHTASFAVLVTRAEAHGRIQGSLLGSSGLFSKNSFIAWGFCRPGSWSVCSCCSDRSQQPTAPSCGQFSKESHNVNYKQFWLAWQLNKLLRPVNYGCIFSMRPGS